MKMFIGLFLTMLGSVVFGDIMTQVTMNSPRPGRVVLYIWVAISLVGFGAKFLLDYLNNC